MTQQIYITGTGLITALADGVDATWNALLRGDFIRDHSRCSTGFQPAPGEQRVTQLAIAAAREAIASANWTARDLDDEATALVVGTSKGPIIEWMTAPPVVDYRTNTIPVAKTIGLHQVADALAESLRLGSGPRLTVSAACASGLHALIHAAMLMRSGRVSRALVVAAEASVHPLFVASFRRLGVLPPEGFGCRPFDVNRRGFLMSEAAVAICLDASESASGLARIERFALGADAAHLTGVDPEGRTLRRLLADVIQDRPVDVVHAHGTATQLNDPIELAAIEQSLPAGQSPPWVYSHKGALGHSLGAAGLVSIVLNTQIHRHRIVPPNVQTRDPLSTSCRILNVQVATGPVRRSVAVATGFGGPTAVVSCISP